MAGVRSILCPTDFSDPSRNAVRLSAALARRFQAHLTVLSVNEPLLAGAAAIEFDDAGFLARRMMESLQEWVEATVPATVLPTMTLRVATGAPVDRIVSTATREVVDLIVMGSHGLGGYRKLFFGSVTEHVLRATPVPVLAVPPASPAVDPETEWTTRLLLVPVAFDDTAPPVAALARELARTFASRLLWLHVVTAPTEAFPPASAADESAADELDRPGAEERLRSLVQPEDGDELLVVEGAAAEEIARVAAERGAGLIVMGLRSGARRTDPRPGSIAYRVLTLGPTLILVVPPPLASAQPSPHERSHDVT